MLTKGNVKYLDTRVKEFNFDKTIAYRRRLPDKLVHALPADDSVALFVDIECMRRAGFLPIDE